MIRKLALLAVLATSLAGTAQTRSSIITAENARPGTTDWLLTKVFRHADEPYSKGWHRRKEVEGYVSHLSIKPGETLKVFVSTEPADTYDLDIYRMGYYGGKGGRLVKSIKALKGSPQPTPSDGENHIIECKWAESASIPIPKDWVSGVYLGKLTTKTSDAQAYIIFIVRDNRKADLMFQCSDLTWVAYNRWPQWRSLYDIPTGPWGAGRKDSITGKNLSYDAGINRPYAMYWNGYPAGFEPLTNGSGEFLMTEFPMAYWLEKHGYDVTYVSNLDAHTDGPGLMRCKGFISIGHDEYWTQEMFDNISKARDEGLNIAFFSGNSVSGILQMLPSSDGRPNRGIHLIRRFSNEEELMGSNSYGVGFADWTCVAPEHWVFEGTGMKKGDSIPNLVGWEYHGPPFGSQKNLEVLAEGEIPGGRRGPRKYAATIYTLDKGNFVFNAATCWWAKPITHHPGYMNPPRKYFGEPDPRVQRITKNVVDRMVANDVR